MNEASYSVNVLEDGIAAIPPYSPLRVWVECDRLLELSRNLRWAEAALSDSGFDHLAIAIHSAVEELRELAMAESPAPTNTKDAITP